jgi:hypothetical protein
MDNAADLNLMPQLHRKQFIVYALLLMGFFFPISQQGALLQSRYFMMYFLTMIAYSFFIKITPRNLIFFLTVNVSLMVFTVAASFWFKEYSFGIYPNFFLLSLLFLLDYTNLGRFRHIYRVQLIVTWLIIILGVGIIIGNATISNFLIYNYSSSFEDLLPIMLAARKPVATFGTHSVASFILFFLFFLNIRTYQIKGKIGYLITSIVILLLLIFIRSNTALGYSAIAFIILFGTFIKKKSSLLMVSGIVVAIFLYVSVIDPTILDVFYEYDILSILTSKDNGLAGRYSGTSVLAPTIDYIKHNPLVPLGLAYSDKLYYTDSGIILYILRGSIILASAIYLGFYSFLKNNLLNKRNTIYVFFFFMIFEIGYPILIDPRVLCFIPFLLVYLNHLSTEENVKSQCLHPGS